MEVPSFVNLSRGAFSGLGPEDVFWRWTPEQWREFFVNLFGHWLVEFPTSSHDSAADWLAEQYLDADINPLIQIKMDQALAELFVAWSGGWLAGVQYLAPLAQRLFAFLGQARPAAILPTVINRIEIAATAVKPESPGPTVREAMSNLLVVLLCYQHHSKVAPQPIEWWLEQQKRISALPGCGQGGCHDQIWAGMLLADSDAAWRQFPVLVRAGGPDLIERLMILACQKTGDLRLEYAGVTVRLQTAAKYLPLATMFAINRHFLALDLAAPFSDPKAMQLS